MSTPPDPVAAARERAIAERAKRLREDGVDQYSLLDGEHERFDRDPWNPHPAPRDPVSEAVDVVILGAGISGMSCAVELSRLGVESYRIIDRAGDVGGTWYWNRYPGCRCDIESYIYMPYLEETGYIPTERYASAPEIFEHCQQVAEQFDLYPHALFATHVTGATWLDDQSRWEVATDRGDVIRARFVVAAGGLLFKAKLPAIEGIDDFEGAMFHTARWDYAVTGGGPGEPMTSLAGMRVGVVGTGATAVQVVPELAESGAEVYVFQRTPAAVGVRDNRPTDPEWAASLKPGWQEHRTRNFTESVTGVQPDEDLVQDGWTDLMWVNTARPGRNESEQAELDRIDFEAMESIRQRVDDIVEDPELAERLKPWWSKHCKRITFNDEYLPTFNRHNVHLVDTDGAGVDLITANGPVVGEVEYALDVLVFASGFEVTTDYTRRLGFDPIGRDGVAMSERWSDGAHTLHGVLTAEFPNFTMVSIAQAAPGVNFAHFVGQVSRHIADMIAACLESGIVEIEPTVEAEDEWLHRLWAEAAAASSRRYAQACTPSYFNNEGQMTQLAARGVTWTGNTLPYADHLADWRAAGFPGTVLRRETEDTP